jgi:hypothetical protein
VEYGVRRRGETRQRRLPAFNRRTRVGTYVLLRYLVAVTSWWFILGDRSKTLHSYLFIILPQRLSATPTSLISATANTSAMEILLFPDSKSERCKFE